jgi:hypothetical protein
MATTKLLTIITLAVIAGAILLILQHVTLFEDGSWIAGHMEGCIKFALCSR